MWSQNQVNCSRVRGTVAYLRLYSPNRPSSDSLIKDQSNFSAGRISGAGEAGLTHVL